MDWHDWLGNISEVSNVVVSGMALYFAIQAGRQAKQLRKEDIANQQRAQASKISAWVADVKISDKKWSHVGIVVQNLSEEPIYDIRITAQCQSNKEEEPKESKLLKLDFLPVGVFYCKAKSLSSDFVDFVEKSSIEDAWEDAKPLSDFNPLPKAVTSTSRRSVTEISFKDANGIGWMRKKNGSLEKEERSSLEDILP